MKNAIGKLLSGMDPVAYWTGAWITLIESIATILTIGIWLPTWTEKWASWRIETRCKLQE